MANKFQKQVKKAINESPKVFADKIVCHGNGEISVKRGFYYRHGLTAEQWGDNVREALNEAGVLNYLERTVEDWKPWPKDSYFVAVFSNPGRVYAN